MNRTGKFILYVVCTILAMVIFLYALFPSDVLKGVILDQIAAVQPQLNIQTDDIKLVFPPGLKISPITLTYAGNPAIAMDQLSISPSLFSMLRETKEFSFSGDIGAGSLKGQAKVDLNAKRPQTLATINLLNIPIDRIDAAKQWPNYQPFGEINGYIDYDSRRNGAGSANVNLELTMAGVTINPPQMGLERLEFNKVEAEITLTPRMLQIKRCDASGLQVEGKIAGSVIFRQPLGQSRISLACTVKPQAAFVAEHKSDVIGGLLTSQTVQKRGMIFRITGTLDNPKYVMR